MMVIMTQSLYREAPAAWSVVSRSLRYPRSAHKRTTHFRSDRKRSDDGRPQRDCRSNMRYLYHSERTSSLPKEVVVVPPKHPPPGGINDRSPWRRRFDTLGSGTGCVFPSTSLLRLGRGHLLLM